MTSNTTAAAVRQHAICYAVIPAQPAAAWMRLRHNIPGSEFSAPGRPLLVRYSRAEFADPDGRLGALRLTADVLADIGSLPPWQHLNVTHSMVALSATASGAGQRAVYNRTATELIHRLGAGLDRVVIGPLVIHAAPSVHGIIASLSDGQLRTLVPHLEVINRSIHGRQPLVATA